MYLSETFKYATATILSIIGLYYARKQLLVMKEENGTSQFSDRITLATAQLGDSDENIRLAGIYNLKIIANESKKHSYQIREILANYIKKNSPNKGKTQGNLPVDIEAALDFIRSFKYSVKNGETSILDLHGTYLHKANLENANLENADLTGTDLTKANLRGANLRGAKLKEATIRGANFKEVKNLKFDQIIVTNSFEQAYLDGELYIEVQKYENKIRMDQMQRRINIGIEANRRKEEALFGKNREEIIREREELFGKRK